MKAAVIGASAESLHSISLAQQMGITVVALDGNPKAEGLQAADKGLLVDISDEEETIRVMKEEKPDFIMTVPIGRYLTTIGAVNDALHLKGISKASATLCTDKYEYHLAMHQAGLRNCSCLLIDSQFQPENILNQADTMNYPLILKPRYGSGSRGIYMVYNKGDLACVLKGLRDCQEDFILEEVAGGTEYGVDASVTDGVFHMILLREKINTPPPVCQAVGYFAVNPEEQKDLYERVERYLERTVSVLHMDNCLFHADLMIRGEQLFAIEVSARPSGHYLHNVFTPMATGVDECQEFMKYMSGEPFQFVPNQIKPIMIHFFDVKEGTVKEVLPVSEVKLPDGITMIAHTCTIKSGDSLEKVTGGHSLMGRGYFILKGTDRENLLQAAEAIKSLIVV